ncbi:MAG: hypothetical protein J6Q22_22265 [Prevotella sp.]|nr:hypothetical protein [Prevotella sp.]
MNTRMIAEATNKRRKSKRNSGGTPKFVPNVGFGNRKFVGAYTAGRAYGPVFPMGCGWGEMSSVPGGPCGDGTIAADASGAGAAMEAVEDIKNDDEDLMISDKDKLIYALRGIIENAKVAYEAVTGVSYDEKDDVPEPKDEDPDVPEENDEEGADEEGSDDD